MTIVAFAGVLILLIIAHELGHFVTAKACGVKVEEFGLGFPPRMVGIKRGETVYSLNWLPFGAFVKLLGEEDPREPRSLASKSRRVRFLVLSAGSVMNLILPVFLFSASLMIPHPVVVEEVRVQEVIAGSPAQLAGITPGDTIIAIDGHRVSSRADVGYLIRLNLGSPVTVTLRTWGTAQRTVRVIPRWNPPPGQGATGIVVQGVGGQRVTVSLPFWNAIPAGAVRSWETLVLFRNEVVSWFLTSTGPQFTGPLGIAQMTGEVAQAGWSPLLEFTALISINLGLLNLFPFPGLDGGRLIFVFLEWLRRGRRISARKEGLIHFVGFVTLLLLIAAISYFDIVRLVEGGSIIP